MNENMKKVLKESEDFKNVAGGGIADTTTSNTQANGTSKATSGGQNFQGMFTGAVTMGNFIPTTGTVDSKNEVGGGSSSENTTKLDTNVNSKK